MCDQKSVKRIKTSSHTKQGNELLFRFLLLFYPAYIPEDYIILCSVCLIGFGTSKKEQKKEVNFRAAVLEVRTPKLSTVSSR